MSLYANLLKKTNANASASSPATISSEPVKYSFKKSEDESREEKKTADAALRFQPVIRRQPQSQQKPKPRPVPSSSSPDKQLPPNEAKPSSGPAAATAAAGATGESIENWIDEDADDYYVAEYTRHKQEEKERQREAKQKRNKKKKQQYETRDVDWDAIYDPEQPIRLDDYKGSLEELDAKYEWKQRLHTHQVKKKTTMPDTRRSAESPPPQKQQNFRASAPVIFSYNKTLNYETDAFAPPSNYHDPPTINPSTTAPLATLSNALRSQHDDDDDYEPPPAGPANSLVPPPTVTAPPYMNTPSSLPPHFDAPPPPPPPPHFNAQSPLPPHFNAPSPLPPQIPGLPFPPPPPPPNAMAFPPGPWQLPPGAVPPPVPNMPFPAMSIPPPPPHFLAAQHPPFIPGITATPTPPAFVQPSAPTPPPAPTPPVQQPSSSSTISRAPVRYTQPESNLDEEDIANQPVGGLGFSAPSEQLSEANSPEPTEEEPRSNRPGQKGFAKRLLQKYGWKEGQGLGATGDGITTILQHQTQKRKKKSDNEGGGWANPAIGKIVGGKKRKIEGADDDDESAAWSIVARFDGMLAGLDIDDAIMNGDLMQTMGEKMAEYGHVERLYIHRDNVGQEPVFVKFTSALSAYRAVQAAEGKDFLGNSRLVKAGFWPEEKFETNVYE